MLHTLELLEPRIAPAALAGKVLTYTDVDGDKVTVTFTKGAPAAGNFVFDTGTVDGMTVAHQQLELIDVHGNSTSPFVGTDLTVTVKQAGGGDGLAAIGRINAAGVSLGKVSIAGDLGAITADSTAAGQPALGKLSVNSLGRYGLRTQAAGGTLESDLAGLGTLKVRHEVTGVTVKVTGTIGSIDLGGSLIGGATTSAGEISATLDIGPVTIGGDLVGGAGAESGYLSAGQGIASLTVGGSLLGGANSNSGTAEAVGNIGAIRIDGDILGGAGEESGYVESDFGQITSLRVGGSLIGGQGAQSGCAVGGGSGVFGGINKVKIVHDIIGGGGIVSGYIQLSGNLGDLKVGGSIIGGTAADTGGISGGGTIGAITIGHNLSGGGGARSGYIESNGAITSVTIGGSVSGGTANLTGAIFTDSGDLGPVRIGHNLVGSSITGTQASLSETGYVESAGNLVSVKIGGSIISGVDNSTGGSLSGSGAVRASNELLKLKVGGSLIGHHTANGDSFVTISGKGQANLPAGATADVAIGSISIGGRVEWTEILAGYTGGLAASDGNAQIGTVKVAGDWIASSLVAGVQNANGPTHFGANGGAQDSIIAPATPQNSISRIASIVIGGAVVGDATSTNGTDQFAFLSAHLGALSVQGRNVALTPDPVLSPLTGDVTVHQLHA